MPKGSPIGNPTSKPKIHVENLTQHPSVYFFVLTGLVLDYYVVVCRVSKSREKS